MVIKNDWKNMLVMGKKLAIRGHSTRGKEVIELLEMMGGKNNCDSPADNLGLCYLIDDDFDICAHYFGYDDYEDGELNIFTLEEFFEKYPFKVGDKVVYTKFGDNCDDYPLIIKSMKWTGTTIEYAFDGYVTCLAKDLKMWTGEPDAAISGIYLNSCDYADKVELYLGDYEIEVRDGKTYAVLKKSKYPNDYKTCCDVLYANSNHNECYEVGLRGYPIQTFAKLLICRDAYWKIAGEEMGLDKPWKPDWKDNYQKKWTISFYQGEINFTKGPNVHRILAFPIEEMRDAFYENFKDLIEQCKELL